MFWILFSFLSAFFTAPRGVKKKTLAAIIHARSKIQSLLGRKLQSKFCPVLHFYEDEKFKKTMETMNLINQVAQEFEEKENEEATEDPCDSWKKTKYDVFYKVTENLWKTARNILAKYTNFVAH